MMANTMLIRPLAPPDRAAWGSLWQGYLTFYEQTLPSDVTDRTWRRLISGDAIAGFVAEVDGALIGFVHYLIHPSTWSTAGNCYLEDLFVAPEAREAGIGRALIEKVFEVADAKGCSRVYWTTKADNARARALYDKLARLSEFVQYRRP
jgi:ribosomal protein S18 acetylase RimI-like enzyme